MHLLKPSLYRVEIEAVCILDMVHKSPGCGNHHIGALSELSLLHLERHACERVMSWMQTKNNQ